MGSDGRRQFAQRADRCRLVVRFPNSRIRRPCLGCCYPRRVRIEALPGWVISDEQSVRADVARYVGMPPDALWREVEDCARDAMWAVRASGFAERVLAYEEPVPESTVVALARLRASRR
jgi:hypothetical protein